MINGHPSSTHQFKYGVPQGAVLSPSLYNIFTSDSPTSSDHETALFADDVAKYKSASSSSTIIKSLTKASKATHKYMRRWRISVNGQKTKAMFISRRRTRQLPPNHIKIFDAEIEWSPTIKYLGLVIDRKLTFKDHIDYVTKRANHAIRILFPLLSRKSRLDTKNKLQIYKLAIRPILTYAAPALKGIAKIHVKRLQITQSKALKLVLNKQWYTSTNEIHEMANIPRIDEYIQKLTEKFESKLA
jgi:hypothetical protein